MSVAAFSFAQGIRFFSGKKDFRLAETSLSPLTSTITGQQAEHKRQTVSFFMILPTRRSRNQKFVVELFLSFRAKREIFRTEDVSYAQGKRLSFERLESLRMDQVLQGAGLNLSGQWPNCLVSLAVPGVRFPAFPGGTSGAMDGKKTLHLRIIRSEAEPR